MRNERVIRPSTILATLTPALIAAFVGIGDVRAQSNTKIVYDYTCAAGNPNYPPCMTCANGTGSYCMFYNGGGVPGGCRNISPGSACQLTGAYCGGTQYDCTTNVGTTTTGGPCNGTGSYCR